MNRSTKNRGPQLQASENTGKFRGWRLLGALLVVVGFLALVSAVVDWLFQSGMISAA